MRNSTLVVLVSVVIAIVGIMLLFVPELRPVAVIFLDGAVFMWNLAVTIVLLIILFVLPWLFGFWTKGWGVAWLDSHLEREIAISTGQRIVLAFVSTVLIGLVWLLLVRFIVQDWNWTYPLFRRVFFWDGVWEGTPAWYPAIALYAACIYLFVWSQTTHIRR